MNENKPRLPPSGNRVASANPSAAVSRRNNIQPVAINDNFSAARKNSNI